MALSLSGLIDSNTAFFSMHFYKSTNGVRKTHLRILGTMILPGRAAV
jgi:hypothetical protein